MMKFFKWFLVSYPWNVVILWLVLMNWIVNIEIWKAFQKSQVPPNNSTATISLCNWGPVDHQGLLENLITLAENTNPQKSALALKRIGMLGTEPEAKKYLSRLDEIALNHADGDIRQLAREAILVIQGVSSKYKKPVE